MGSIEYRGIAQKELIPAFQRATNAEVVAIASESGLSRAREVVGKFDIETTYDSYDT